MGKDDEIVTSHYDDGESDGDDGDWDRIDDLAKEVDRINHIKDDDERLLAAREFYGDLKGHAFGDVKADY